MSFTFQNPFAYFNNPANSNPVGLGNLYVGLPDTDPVTPANQVSVFAVQPDGSELQIPQPVRMTAGGVLTYSGTPIQLRLNAALYSVKVTSSSGAQLLYTARVKTPTDENLREDLANGTADVGGETSGDLARKYNEYPSIKDEGAAGDGSTSDQAAFDAVISTAQDSILLPDKGRYLVTSTTNPLGKEFFGNGHLVKAATGGLEAQNTYADHYQRMTGQEYLAAWFKNVWFQFLSPTAALKIVFSGDSTTAGVGVNAGYLISELVQRGLAVRGLQGAYGVTVVNRGQSGAATFQWDDTFVAGDITEAGNLYVIRWGINDPGWLKNGTAAPIDAGQDYPNRRDVNDFAASLRSGLAKMRAALPFETTSILLMMPNSTYDIPNGRDALWYEQLRDVYVQAARDFNCAFIDTYAIMQDSRKLFNILMDDPMPTSGRGIHPNDAMNSIIAGYICDFIAPEGFKYRFAKNNIVSVSGAATLPPFATQPNEFDATMYHSRASLAQGWPLDGAATTIRTADDISLQLIYGFLNADRGKLKVRFGRAATLGGEPVGFSAPWDVPMSPDASEIGLITASTGFSQYATRPLSISVQGNAVLIEGAVSKSSLTTISANQELAQYTGNYGIGVDVVQGIATVFSGSVFENIGVYMSADGILRAVNASVVSAERVYISISYIRR